MGKRQKEAANMERTTNDSSLAKVKRTRKSASRDATSQRSSVYRGVTRHRWTGRYEAHLWDKNCWNKSQNKKGKQVYLGAYDDEEAAAHAYDLAALKYWGRETVLNFQLSTYQEELKEMEGQSREEYIGTLRRKSSGFSRGVSKYRGVARHHHNGRWEARIGRVLGNKYLYLGTYATQEEAAMAYDMAAIEHRGLNAVTNFDLSRYSNWTKNSGEVQMSNIAASSMSSNNSTMDDLGHSYQLRGQQQFTEAVPRSPVTESAAVASEIGQLRQSLKFQEMAAVSSSSTSSYSSSPPPPPRSLHGSRSSRCSFPDDIQTYFECHDGGSFIEEEDAIFGDFNTFVSYTFPI